MAIGTLSDLVFHVREVSSGHPELLSVRYGSRRERLSAADFLRSIHSLTLALEARGLEPGDRVALFSENRPEWQIADFACQLLGVATVPLSPALPRRQVAFILRNSGSRWVFYSDGAKRDLLLELEPAFTSPPELVAFDSAAAAPAGTSITRLMGEGAERLGEVPIERFRGRVKGDDLATLLYAVGTSGDPARVELSHSELISSLLACDETCRLSPADLAISSLALSEEVQRTVDHACFYRGAAIRYVPSIGRLAETLRREQPTVLTADSAVYESSCRRTLERVRRASPLRRQVFRWSLAVGERRAAASRGGFVGPLLALQGRLAELLVYRGLRRRFGGRLRLAIAGRAPLAPEVGSFFAAWGLPVLGDLSPRR